MSPEPVATCPSHPEAAAVGSCTRCGAFLCAADWTVVDGAGYCPACAARDDVDYLEAFRKKYWGKRDSWGWLVGLAAPFQILGGMLTLLTGEAEAALTGILLALSGVNGAFFFFGVRLARVGLVLLTFAWAAVYFFTVGPVAIGAAVIGGLTVASILTTVRTKLFFEMEVPRGALAMCWDQLANNVVARQALALSIGGLIVPGLGPLAVVLGVVGLSRVDRQARPPVGKLPHAIAAIVLGLVGCAFSALIVWNVFRAIAR